MFEHFTFGPQAQNSYTTSHHEEAYPSPTDCTFEVEPPPIVEVSAKGGMNDIVSAFSTQSLRPEDDELPQRSTICTPLTPDFDDEMPDFSPEELSYLSTTRGKVSLAPLPHAHSVPTPSITSPKNGAVACRRLQRQLNVQLQTCSSHIRDISTLVEDMISTSSQCRLRQPVTHFVTVPLELDTEEDDTPALHEDEGFAEIDETDELEMSLRRASAPSGIRKLGYNSVRYRGSGECVGAGPNELICMGRRKVRCLPRMRRRREKGAVS